MGDQADDILSSFSLLEEDRNKYKTVLDKFQGYFVKRKNIIFERARFNRRKQEVGEPVEDFIMDLYRLSEHCGYGTLLDEMIRNRIVVGLLDAALSEKLQLDPDLNLDKAVKTARESESIKQQQTLLRNDFQEERVVDTLEKQSSWCHGNFKKKPKKDTPQTPPKTCPRCGRSPEHSRQQCPAREEQCYKYGKRGHFQIMCRSKVSRNVSVVESADQDAFIGAVQDSEHENPWIITLAVNGKPLKFKIDTGADVSVIPHKLFKNIPGASLTPVKKILSGPGYKGTACERTVCGNSTAWKQTSNRGCVRSAKAQSCLAWTPCY